MYDLPPSTPNFLSLFSILLKACQLRARSTRGDGFLCTVETRLPFVAYHVCADRGDVPVWLRGLQSGRCEARTVGRQSKLARLSNGNLVERTLNGGTKQPVSDLSGRSLLLSHSADVRSSDDATTFEGGDLAGLRRVPNPRSFLPVRGRALPDNRCIILGGRGRSLPSGQSCQAARRKTRFFLIWFFFKRTVATMPFVRLLRCRRAVHFSTHQHKINSPPATSGHHIERSLSLSCCRRHLLTPPLAPPISNVPYNTCATNYLCRARM